MGVAKKNGQDTASGFTLIETAIVLLVISVMTSGLVLGVPQYLNYRKTELTNDRMELVSNALSVYAQRHYRLPCPADTDGANRGMERNWDAVTNVGWCFSNNASDESLYTSTEGVLPWRELGLSEHDVADGWGRYITYKPAPQLTVNTYASQMQNDDSVTDSLLQSPEIHNACRNQMWYNEGRNHMNRQKALFCCNSHPKPTYLTSTGAQPLSGTWRDNAITVAGIDNDDDTSNDNVVSTNAWIDDYAATDGSADANLYAAGNFNQVYDDAADAPLIRASGHAVTLISHGGNGAFSFLRKTDSTTRRDATMNVGAAPDMDIQQADTQDERKNVWPPQIFAATIGTSKSAAHDKASMRAGVSDDVVKYLRSDQLFSKAGRGSTCVRPAGGDYTCPAFSYGNYVYVLDTSKSMNEQGLGDTRYNVSLTTLKGVDDPADAIDTTDSLLAQHVTSEGKNDSDPDVVGFTGLAYATKIEMEETTGADEIVAAHWVVTGETCTTVSSECTAWSVCGGNAEGCTPKCTQTSPVNPPQEVCKNTYGWDSAAAEDEYNTVMGEGGIKISNKEWLPALKPENVYLNYDPASQEILSLSDATNQASTIEKAGSKLTATNPDGSVNDNYLKPDDNGTALFHTLIESAKLLGQTVPDPEDPAKTITQYGTLDEPTAIMMISDGADSITSLFGTKDVMVNALNSESLYQHLLANPDAADPAYDQVVVGREQAGKNYYSSLYANGEISKASYDTVIAKLNADGYDHTAFSDFVSDMRVNGNVSKEAFFGYIMSANYPFMRINIIDVSCHAPDGTGSTGCNDSLQGISEATNGAYIPTIDQAALEAYLRELSSCLGDS